MQMALGVLDVVALRGRHVLSESILAPDKSWTLILLSCSVKFPPGNSSPRRGKRRGGGANSRETSCLIKLRLTRRGQLGYGRGYHGLTTAGISNRLATKSLANKLRVARQRRRQFEHSLASVSLFGKIPTMKGKIRALVEVSGSR